MFLRSLAASVLLRGNRQFERATELHALNGNLCWQQQNREQPTTPLGIGLWSHSSNRLRAPKQQPAAYPRLSWVDRDQAGAPVRQLLKM